MSHHTKSGLNTPFLVETRQKAKGFHAEERKDFKPKGGYQGGFGITHLEHMQVSDITAPLCLDWYSKKSFSLTLASILENL